MDTACISTNTQFCAVIGNPIGHSLSPAIHNAAFAAKGLDFVYLAFRIEDVAGVLAGVLNYVPYIGPAVVVGTLMVAGLLTFPTLTEAVVAPVIFLAIVCVEGQFLTPALMGRRLELNPVAVFLSISFWSWIWGFVGALLAVPLLVVIKVVCDHFETLRPFGNFLSAQQQPRTVQDE